jgi:hypothetical protein
MISHTEFQQMDRVSRETAQDDNGYGPFPERFNALPLAYSKERAFVVYADHLLLITVKLGTLRWVRNVGRNGGT